MPPPSTRPRPTWWDQLAALEAFLAEHGRLPRQRDTHPHQGLEVPVGRWLMHQRQRPPRDPAQRRALERALAGHPTGRDDTWAHHLGLLTAYVAEHGALPAQRTHWRGVALGQWVADQRKAHRLGRLAAERAAALEATPRWSWSAPETAFELGLEHFVAYRAEHGTGWVPGDYDSPDGYPLGNWAKERRRARQREPERSRALTEAGFVYAAPRHGAGGPSPQSFAGSLAARRMPHLSVQEVLDLRAVSVLARAHLRATEPADAPTSRDVELLPYEVDVLTDAGWAPQPPMAVTRLGLTRIDWAALEEPVRRAVRDACYVLFVNGWPTLGPVPPSPAVPDAAVGDLPGLADLWDRLDAVHPLTERERAWLTGEVGTYADRAEADARERSQRHAVIARHRRTWLRRYQALGPVPWGPEE